MTKQELLEYVQVLPDDITPEQLADELEKLSFRAQVEVSVAQLDRGEGIPHEEIEKKIDQWVQESEIVPAQRFLESLVDRRGPGHSPSSAGSNSEAL